jgi:hypothetical protein
MEPEDLEARPRQVPGQHDSGCYSSRHDSSGQNAQGSQALLAEQALLIQQANANALPLRLQPNSTGSLVEICQELPARLERHR